MSRVAIIVPFRDHEEDQSRTQQLASFVPLMTQFLSQGEKPFKIYIVEQSQDQRKFNRGKLLNVGYVLALQDNCETFVLHDVDLIPSNDLYRYYTSRFESPIHIARLWDRYNSNPKYFGGIATFTKDQYERINGYPNNYWGWGGEDDELYKRLEATKTKIIKEPTSGSIRDLENKTLEMKVNELRSRPEIKCMNKIELLNEHNASWQTNGLSSFVEREQFRIIQVASMSEYAVKVTVELFLNNHWTDKVCFV